MLGLIQRVSHARVEVNGQVVGKIGRGLLLLLGVQREDTTSQADRLLDKVLQYRVFADSEGKMNLNVGDIDGGVLVVSQFTLAADTGKGLRPSFSKAAPPQLAEQLFDYFVAGLREKHTQSASGVFGANMQVSLLNDGPVTFLLET